MNKETYYVVYLQFICERTGDFDYKIFYAGPFENQATKIRQANKGSEISVYPPFCYAPDKEPATIMQAYENMQSAGVSY